MSKQTKNNQTKSGQNKKVATQIIVAALGCAGTVLAALVTGIISLVSLLYQPKSATDISSVSTPTLLIPPTPQIIATSSPTLHLAEFSSEIGCFSYVLPSNITPSENLDSWIYNLPAPNEVPNTWLVAPEGRYHRDNNTVDILIKITNVVNDDTWIRLEKDVSISISQIKNINMTDVNTVTFIQICGGGGYTWYFSAVELSKDFDAYQQQTSLSPNSLSNADYFTLQPGETEYFVFELKCGSVGAFSVQFNIPYSYKDSSGTFSYNLPRGIICPNKFTNWILSPLGAAPGELYALTNIDRYEWTGDDYSIYPP